MTSLSSLTLRGNIKNALVKPGGYKLKAAAFSDRALLLEREASSAKVLYERSENARDEINTILSLLDPLVYDYLNAITDGKTKYEPGRILDSSGQEQQDAILTTLAAIGICLQTGLMEHETMSKMTDHLEEASSGLAALEKDARTSYSAHNMTNLLDTMQSGPLAADLLGLSDGESTAFKLPLRPAAARARTQAPYEEIFGEDDIYTRSPPPRSSRKSPRQAENTEPSKEISSGQLVLRGSNTSGEASISEFFRR